MTRLIPRPLARVAVTTLAVVVCAAGCAGDRAAGDRTVLDGEITVAAASSLTAAFTSIGADFEADHPGARVTFTFDSSGALARQILEGAPADVVAFADVESMGRLVQENLIDGPPVTVARNRLAIVTKPGNPGGIASLSDLGRVSTAGVVALCAETAPCGRLAGRLLADAGVAVPEHRVTRGQNARATLTAVSEGDAVAAIVYLTDARAAGDQVAVVEVSAADDAEAVYPVAVLSGSDGGGLARAFVDHVTSPAGRAVLDDLGFLPPR